MASRLTTFGNDLYTGKRSFNFVGGRRKWYVIAAVLVILSIVVPLVRGVNFSIEFLGGSQFQITNVQNATAEPATEAVASVVPDATAKVTIVGDSGVRVQTDQLSQQDSHDVSAALAEAYDVPVSEVTSSFIGPSWGADVTRQAIVGLIAFLLLAGIIMAIYFRTWKMSLAAILALIGDLIVTVGVYAAVGFEISPAAMIGVLTILSYSLYDTVVVFDKIRENTADDGDESRRTFAESVNLAVNQTLVRSINTSVIAALPVAAILFIGAGVLGADTLRDISLSLLIGILVGTWSTVFVAAPLYSQLREGEPAIKRHDQKVLKERERAGSSVAVEA
ncbi:protein translocase subunit SecF [Agromyces mediolanus]|jgi:preprotein translocase subunit SecF|uniref:Protein-export membrane protein SecF n=1 Tax=Agromyces mediolanus TaxID=41986 RepID=A0A918CGZ3_AGRME|nr:protein translocase subunit SecF [Agromyces mediolanus]MCD1570110.1 protein translocase subunit SecF [Agromyces mediolanus]GGR24657.1 protein-export membrane protein SecF [Agromyces mediolanus]GLJ70928.1 protein-export membrane protein SecF [Agromyces mediolanus]